MGRNLVASIQSLYVDRHLTFEQDFLIYLCLCSQLIEMSSSPVPVVYGGGIHSSSAIELMEELGAGVLDFTLTDSLDIFGGPFEFSKLAAEHGRFTPTTRISDQPHICTLCRMF
uniref:Phosphoribosylformimino-5-aminoimidazole carboxamide ribotide isomerase n=1 Tax=Lotharella globosa TaxID=91324 RepID=A0A7S4DIN0_9EUKA